MKIGVADFNIRACPNRKAAAVNTTIYTSSICVSPSVAEISGEAAARGSDAMLEAAHGSRRRAGAAAAAAGSRATAPADSG
jgi:hypothetical protein